MVFGRGLSLSSVIAVAATLNPCSDLVGAVRGRSEQRVQEAPPKSEVSALAPATTADVERSAFDEAKKLCAAGDCQTAHERMGILLPATSPIRQSPEFRALESQWAKAAIAGAANDPDVAARRRILEEVVASPSVDASLKTKAQETLAALPSSVQTPHTSTGFDAELSAAASGVIPSTSQFAKAKPLAKRDPKKARALLLPRAATGKADADELKLLSSVCSTLKDDACVERTEEMLGARGTK